MDGLPNYSIDFFLFPSDIFQIIYKKYSLGSIATAKVAHISRGFNESENFKNISRLIELKDIYVVNDY